MKKTLALLFLASFALMGCPEANSNEKTPTKSAVHSHEDGSTHGDHSHGHGEDHQHGDDAHEQEEFTVGEEGSHDHDGHSHEDHEH